MRKIHLLLTCLVFISAGVSAQKNKNPKVLKDTIVNNRLDSLLNEMKDDIANNIPVVTLDDNDMGDGSSQNVSSLLTAGRDPFFSAATFNFGAARFKIRGYDGDLFGTYINGIPMDNLDNGFTPFGLWGGLNDVVRNRDLSLGLRYNTFAFGDLGSVTNIDTRASKQRKETEFGYAASNRNYNHRIHFTYGSGISKKGWAFTFAGSRRYAAEGYVPGTYYDGWSWFAAVDKRLGQKHLLSFTAFGAPTESGKQGAAITEARELAGTNYYNPYWGYQNGKKRNANIARTNQPVAILTHDFRINNNTSLISAIGYSFGKRGSTSLDWFNAPDPRPDYYRYLPSYYATVPSQQQQVTDLWKNDPSVSQINWDRLYDANRSNNETFNGTTGRRARYLLSESVTDTKRFNFNTVVNTRINNNIEFTGGASYQYQKNNYYKEIDDMLGADYFVDLNQFAERNFPNNNIVNQNDLNRPNRIVRKGDRYGWDYDMNIHKFAGWAQSVFKFKKIDVFTAVEVSNTTFWRVGNVRNGLFPNNSFGKSQTNNFTNYALKGGITYKVDGRNYFYLNGAYLTRAPFFENVYTSPRTRDLQQDNTTSEKIKSVEGGYVLNAPKLKIRLGGYYTEFDDQMNVMSFYHDTYQNFVNYAVSNIDKLHFGGEFGFEAKVMPNVTVTGAAAIGRYYYNSRQNAVTTLDNDASILSQDTVYSMNYRVGGTPQEAYSLGVSYRSPKFWFVSITANYFDQMWLDINPLRRSYAAVKDVPYKSDLWNSILGQEQFSSQYTVDFFGGYSWKLPKSMGFKKNTFLVFNVGVSNLLNNKNIITGGFEQLRFDFENRNINKFPPKYYYAFGANFFASATLRF